MTTEDAFNAALDATPDDHVTRLVFADWLEEQGDPRAEGYRALGLLRLCPRPGGCWVSDGFSAAQLPPGTQHEEMLPHDWWAEVCRLYRGVNLWPIFGARRSAEDAAAIAFSRLPAERRAELLAAPAVA